MLKNKTTLVLGAGASRAMGFPTGAGLLAAIHDLVTVDRQPFAIQAGLFNPDGTALHEFIDAFRGSQMYSIDSFLARRPQFSDIGKRAIAAVLLECEKASSLDRCTHADGWMQYLWNKFGAASWDELDFSCLRVVTFNYDRSLEHYLLQAIIHSHGVTQKQALWKLQGLKVVHVYGSLSAPLPDGDGYLAYGHGTENHAPAIVAKHLQVIPEGRNDSAVLTLAHQHLLWADKIAFMGFGFDPVNMGRLDSQRTCQRQVDRPGGPAFREIIATGFGLTDVEIEAAALLIGDGSASHGRPRFYKTDCLTMLRESGLLQ